MSEIRVLVLGAGQEVGRSCVVVRLGGRTVMFDCGMHAGRRDDARRFPLLRRLTSSPSGGSGGGGGVAPHPDGGGGVTACIDAVLVSHFHLDHVGALPYLVGVLGYRGPVVMTAPTAAVTPIMLDDYRRGLEQVIATTAAASAAASDGQQQQQQQRAATFAGAPAFSREHVAAAMSRVVVLGLRETLDLRPHLRSAAAATAAAAPQLPHAASSHNGPPFEVTAYYAGHVLGACMFHVRAGDRSVLYTGDHSGLDAGGRHLAAARLPAAAASGLRPPPSLRPPDLCISEATYASSVRGDGGRAAREGALLDAVERCVRSGGRALFPVYAVGRAQELMALVERRWRQQGQQQQRLRQHGGGGASGGGGLAQQHHQGEPLAARVPVYAAGGMAARASAAYRLLAGWAAPGAAAGGEVGEEEEEDDDDDEDGGNQQQPKHHRFACSSSRRARAFRFPLVRPLDRAGLERLLRGEDPSGGAGGGGGGGGPCVLFASPGTLGGGASLAAFRAWAPDPRNLVVLPSYQVAGTLGCRLLAGETRGVELPGGGGGGRGKKAAQQQQQQDPQGRIDIRCQVRYAPFSAHADASGLLRVLDAAAPRAVALVHGDRDGMDFLAARLRRCPPGGGGGGGDGAFPVFCPKTGEEVVVPTDGGVTVLATRAVLDRARADEDEKDEAMDGGDGDGEAEEEARRLARRLDRALARESFGRAARLGDAVLLADADSRFEAGVRLRLVTLDEAVGEVEARFGGSSSNKAGAAAVAQALQSLPAVPPPAPPPPAVRVGCYVPLSCAAAAAPDPRAAALEALSRAGVPIAGSSVRVRAAAAAADATGQRRLCCSWLPADAALGERCVRVLRGDLEN